MLLQSSYHTRHAESRTGFILQSALHLKLLEYWFNRELQGKPT